MRSLANRVPALALSALSSLAFAQSNVGELLDAGARRMSAEEFKAEIVQRTIIGLTATGAKLEIVYATNGSIQGIATGSGTPQLAIMNAPVSGDWGFDVAERVCTSMRIQGTLGQFTILPPRCQYWYKLGEAYFIADSDTDRRAKVLRRTLKP